ncbi:hypothetical protein FACS1894217_05750 [Clostridia bacterium]|nr:hypothetical protein FACS1894217_05750 [Clostridia bacterium]
MDEELKIAELEDVEIEGEEGAVADFPWVLFSIDAVVYGIFSAHVLSIEILDDTTPLVSSPDYTRGITNFRGEMISLIDLRTLFGLPDRYQELNETIAPFFNSLNGWMMKLEECVSAHRHFPFSLDQKESVFGKWYYAFATTNSELSLYLQRLEAPYAAMYKAAEQIAELIANEEFDESARVLAEQAGPAHAELISLLEGVVPTYQSGARDMIVVLEVDDVVKGVIVDEIVSVEYISRILEMDELSEKTEFVRNLGKREKDNSTVQMLDEQKIIAL